MQSLLRNRSCLALRPSLMLRFAYKQEVPPAALAIWPVRNYSVYSTNPRTQHSNPLTPARSRYLLQNQLNVISFPNSKRLLSSETEKALPTDFSEEIIDLSGGSAQELVKSITLTSQQLSDIPITALGLSDNYSPIGWCLHYLEFLHSALPWWAAIPVATLCFRILIFPLVIQSQKTSSKLNELLPQQAILQEKMNQARLVGDSIEFARLSNEFQTLFKRNNVSPIRSFMAPFAQVPLFVTFFLTLRRMANYPVESLKTGGLSWFTDLSIPDPFYILPIFSCVTLWATLETSFRSGMNPSQTVLVKYAIRVIPALSLLFTYHFPAAIMVYWSTNSLLSVVQVFLLARPPVRKFLNIPLLKVNPKKLDVHKKTFKNHFKDTIENARIKKILEERKSIDDISFKKAGIGPLKKTFKSDPFKVGNNQ